MIVLLIDFDRQEDRLHYVKNRIQEHLTENQFPADLIDRVFILGVISNPEELTRSIPGLNSLEEIGKALSQDCAENTYRIWGHDLLKHNKTELDRMLLSVRPFLFN